MPSRIRKRLRECPLSKAQRYWLAFHEADHACYDFEEGHIDSKALGAAVKNARNILTIGTNPGEPSGGPQSRAARDPDVAAAPKPA